MRTPADHSGRMFGLPCCHSWHALFVLDAAINEVKPQSIIELGTGSGGVSVYLAARATVGNIAFRTLDVRMCRSDAYAALEGIKRGAFKLGDGTLPRIAKEASAKFARKWLVYNDCGDGACKQKAFAVWAKQMEHGDVMCLHDWPGSGATGPPQWPADFEAPGFQGVGLLNDLSEQYGTAQHWLRKV